MASWRLLGLDVGDAFTNMAVDEAIVAARMEDLVPNTLRFYRWNPSAVSVGRFQNIFNEVHLENCRKHGVDIVRRITGGGAVYHDFEGEITYSVVAREEDLGAFGTVKTYKMICGGLIEATKILGVKADFMLGDPKNCPNVTVGGKKISGSAQFRKGGVLLQHGTFLLSADLEKMFTFLKVPWAKSLEDVVCVAQERLTSIKQELKKAVSIENAHQALIEGFQKVLNTRLELGEDLTSLEKKFAEKLREEKFTSHIWNFEGSSRNADCALRAGRLTCPALDAFVEIHDSTFFVLDL